jgi:ATP-dependent Clp protease ATP-binding subunit ClpC
MLLQIMEEGRLTDSFGRHVDFKNTIMIMTSNIGADKITHQATFGFERRDEEVSYQNMKDMLKGEVERYFRPEFLNRVDDMVVFRKLSHVDLERIIGLEVSKVSRRLKEHGLTLELTDEAREFLIEKGTDEKFGARPLRRAIEHHVEDPLSENILRGYFRGKDKISVRTEGEGEERKLVFDGVSTTGEGEQAAAVGAGAGADVADGT